MITDASIKSALRSAPTSGKKTIELKDDGPRGEGRLTLIMRVSKSRISSEWYAVWWDGGKRGMAKMGAYPTMGLGEARRSFAADCAPAIAKGERPEPKFLKDKADMANDLRDLAERTASPWLMEAAAHLSTGAESERIYIAFWQVYEAYSPAHAAQYGATVEAAQGLRTAALAALETRPVTPSQLGEKLRIAATIGVHRIIKRSWPEPCSGARWFLEHHRTFHEDLASWFYLDSVGFDPLEVRRRPANIGRADRHYIRQALEAVGAAWAAALAADMLRLRGGSVAVSG